MHSDLPKILHPLAGRPAIDYLLTTVSQLHPDTLQLVVRYQAQRVIDAVRPNFPAVHFVRQSETPGTAAAVSAAVEDLGRIQSANAKPAAHSSVNAPSDSRARAPSDPEVMLVLAGDAPLVSRSLLEWLLEQHQRSVNQISLISSELADPTGYGRIVRNAVGDLRAIVEQNDATPEQLQIREVNNSVYAFDLEFLRKNLGRINSSNAKSEFYLTDLIALADTKQAYLYPDSTVLQSFNTRAELAKIEERLIKTEGIDA
jgi:bifunctional UDP-N-acetylglucosamine pyrophosphorylase/glucosamine-1-phosphate N-acetyltransferase